MKGMQFKMVYNVVTLTKLFLEQAKMVSSFSEWYSYRAFITIVDVPPDTTRYLLILPLSYLYVYIATRTFDPSWSITVFLANFNFNLSRSYSYITRVLTSSISGWSVNVMPLLLLRRNFLSYFILKGIFYHTSPCQMDFLIDVICIVWVFLWERCPVETLLANIYESKLSTENIVERIIYNVYSLSA